jgi:hypothetical protein
MQQRLEQRAHGGQRDAMSTLDAIERVLRHVWIGSVRRVLHHTDAAASLDRGQARGSVVEVAGEDDADHAALIRHGGGAKQWIDARPRAVLSRAFGHTQFSLHDQQVMVGRSHVDVAGLEGLRVVRLGAAKGPSLVHRVEQRTPRRVRRHVMNDDDRSWEVPRQLRDQPRQRVHSSCRGSHDHDPRSAHEKGYQGWSTLSIQLAWNHLVR